MMIVCTKDQQIVDWTNNNQSGANNWGNTYIIPAGNGQGQATLLFGNALSLVGVNEPLCLSAHGSDTEIGDAGNGHNDWTWNVNAIANLLINNVPGGYAGPVLIRTCANQITNFSARLAVNLQNVEELNGLWIYGYNRAVLILNPYPNPNNLANQVDLQGTQVHFQ